ncbi:MAG TPA: DUF1810 domain-containing protein [Acidisarcina sp.]
MNQSTDPHNLDRFVEAQAQIYNQVCEELRRGRKTGHWMWFIFPQIAGLGLSSTSMKFAIQSREEAQAYLDHPVLGPRLIECTEILLQIEGRTSREIFGGIDNMKFRSSMTLFANATTGDPEVFQQALNKYFDGEQDQATLDLL